MNKIKLIIALLTSIFCAGAHAGLLVEEAGKKLLPATEKKFFTTLFEERQERLASLKKTRAELQSTEKEFNNTINATLEQLKTQINTLEQNLKFDSDNEFLKRKLELLLERSQLLNDLKYSRSQVIALIDEHIKLIQEYLADPDLKKFVKERIGVDKSTYSFDDDLLNIHEMLLSREKDISILTEQEGNATVELENRKRACQASTEACNNKKEKKETPQSQQRNEILGLTARQKNDLIALDELLAQDRQAVDAMRLQEAENKLSLIKSKLIIARQQHDILKAMLSKIKPLTKISEADVAIALDELDKKKQQSFALKDEYRQHIEKLVAELKSKERELEVLSKRYNIPLGTVLDEWAKDPRRTVNAYIGFAHEATLNDEVLLLKRRKELLEAHVAFEEEKLRNESLRINVKDSFFKMINARFATEEQVTKEIKKYDIPRTEIKANLALYKERQNTLAIILNAQKKALENIDLKKKIAEQEKNTLFKEHENEYETYKNLLSEADNKIQEQIDIIGKINTVYTDILSKISNSNKHIDFINSELGSITIWYRPEHAISWEGIRNILPDAQLFLKDVKEYVSTLSFGVLMSKFNTFFDSPIELILFIFKVLLLLIFLLVIKIYLPHITSRLLAIEHVPFGIRWVSILTAVFLGFGIKHLISLVIWISLFLLLVLNPISDPYPYILFYLISIPYLLYLANRWMNYLVYFNEKYNYVFLSKDYQERFVIVVSSLVYATIIIVFFREAFILGNYHKSELPTILLAINFIIFQISAILLLSKDQIISLISTRSDFGKWIHDLVDTYYYLLQFFLIAIIVMSNPYVGYGRLVLYVLKRLLYTAIVLQLLIWINEWFKRVSSRIFFYFDVDDEIARDRFYYAKTWYGLLVVIMLGVVSFIGLLIIARIWNWPEALVKVSNWSDVMYWIKTPFLLQTTKAPISLLSIFKVIGFIFGGSLIAFIINRFVLRRIYDILLVDAGIQNTISSLIRYLVIITAIFFGFHAVGLGEIVLYLVGGLILGIGWVIKEPVSDLIAYFIIIVQRPLKVGDYIYIDEGNSGIVRRITPRSVELRRKNSTSVIVPNVIITTRPMTNWNYARGFIAFEDIMVTVPYKVDPERVRELLIRVLDESKVILKNPRPIVRLENFSELGFVFMVRGYLSSNHTLDMWDIASEVRFAIVKRLYEHGIQLACPVRIIMTGNGAAEMVETLKNVKKD